MSETVTAMATYLNQEVEAAKELLLVLEEEQSYLLTTDIEKLEPLVAKKAELVAQLSQYTRDRNELLKKAGHEATLSGMNAWLENAQNKNVDTTEHKNNWDILVSLSQSAKEQNRLNGLLISSNMARNQQALAILHGNNKQNTGLYGPDGHHSRIPATPVRSVVTG